jgi:DNA repair exonuclease SbcCD nuclease subunit
LDELKKLQEDLGDCPIICAGDIFDKWNSPPELINFAIDNLPEKMICIPGQHDLPLHNIKDIKKSAYWTLAACGKIINGRPVAPTTIFPDPNEHVRIKFHHFPFGRGLKNCNRQDSTLHVAVVHEYIWIKGHSYTKAPKENQVGAKIHNINQKYKGYDVIIYGDNHKGFHAPFCKTQIWNCGSLMRRNSDQLIYEPRVGVLYSDGSIDPHYLDISQDEYLDISTKSLNEDSLDMGKLIRELEKLDSSDLDFTEVMEQYLKKNSINISICNILRKAMGLG